MGLLDSLKGAFGGKKSGAAPAVPAAGAAAAGPAGAAKGAEDEKRALEAQLKLAETKYLEHEIDELTFRQLTERNQSKLVSLEAQAEVERAREQVEQTINEQAAALGPAYREKLAALLRQKVLWEKTLEVANRKYLKRLLREETYLNVSREVKKKVIEVEALVEGLYKEAARKIMVETQARLALAGVEESPVDVEEEAEEIAEQLPRTPLTEGWPKPEVQQQPAQAPAERRHGRERQPAQAAQAPPAQAPAPETGVPRRLRHRH